MKDPLVNELLDALKHARSRMVCRNEASVQYVDEVITKADRLVAIREKHAKDKTSREQKDFTYEIEISEDQRVMLGRAMNGAVADLDRVRHTLKNKLSAEVLEEIDEYKTLRDMICFDLPKSEKEIPGCLHGLCL